MAILCSFSSETPICQILGKNRSQNFIVDDKCKIKKECLPFFSPKKFTNTIFDISRYFLPKGYPESVSSGYLSYVTGQALTLLVSSAGSVLSMQALLYAMGLGQGSIPLAATLNWIIKDGAGQLGGVIFAGLVNNKFDSDPKRWRMISAISMECSSFMEILTPLAPGYFLVIASVANIGKNISYLSASASRAAIHKSFAIHENLADVVAKSGSQSIFASMTGTALGAFIATTIHNDYEMSVLTFIALSCVSQLLAFHSLKYVKLNTLSISRFHYLYHVFKKQHRILTPEEFISHEVLLGSPMIEHHRYYPIRIGCNFDEAVTCKEELEV